MPTPAMYENKLQRIDDLERSIVDLCRAMTDGHSGDWFDSAARAIATVGKDRFNSIAASIPNPYTGKETFPAPSCICPCRAPWADEEARAKVAAKCRCDCHTATASADWPRDANSVPASAPPCRICHDLGPGHLPFLCDKHEAEFTEWKATRANGSPVVETASVRIVPSPQCTCRTGNCAIHLV